MDDKHCLIQFLLRFASAVLCTDIPLTARPIASPGAKKRHPQQQPEPPPSYTTLQRSPCTHKDKSTLNQTMCDAYKQQVRIPCSKTQYFRFVELHSIARLRHDENYCIVQTQ